MTGSVRAPEPYVLRRGHGVPLIVIHGNGVDHRLLLPLDDCFDDGAWERIYVDLPGFGRTPALPGVGGLPEVAAWLVDVVGQFVGTRQFAVLANSLGGLLARHVVAQFGEQVIGMALIAPVVDPDAAKRTVPQASVIERDDVLLATLAPADREQFAGMAVRQTADSWELFRDHALPGIRAADIRAMARLGRRYFLQRVPEAGSDRFTGPVLIVTGRQDHVVGYADQDVLAAEYASARYVVLENAGHNVHLDQPAAVSSLLRKWAGQALAEAREVSVTPSP